MYGLINKALRNMIRTQHGEITWQAILKESKVSEDSFITMHRYDDKVTYDLVAASSKILDAPPETCLELFGHYWATVTAPEAYGMLMETTGQSMVDFLENINQLHDRIISTFIGYVPPYFEVDTSSDEIALRYESQREGLTPFVLGILKGLGERFGEEPHFHAVEKCDVDQGETSIIRFTLTEIS